MNSILVNRRCFLFLFFANFKNISQKVGKKSWETYFSEIKKLFFTGHESFEPESVKNPHKQSGGNWWKHKFKTLCTRWFSHIFFHFENLVIHTNYTKCDFWAKFLLNFKTFIETVKIQNIWYFVTKIVLVIEKDFWYSRLKAENFQNFWDHLNNLFKQWKVRTIFGNRMLF